MNGVRNSGIHAFDVACRALRATLPVCAAIALLFSTVGCAWWQSKMKPELGEAPAFRQDPAPAPFRSPMSTSARTSRPKAGLSEESQAIEKSLGL